MISNYFLKIIALIFSSDTTKSRSRPEMVYLVLTLFLFKIMFIFWILFYLKFVYNNILLKRFKGVYVLAKS